MRRKIRFMKNELFQNYVSKIRITTKKIVRKLVRAHNQHIASPMTDNNKSSYQSKNNVISSRM